MCNSDSEHSTNDEMYVTCAILVYVLHLYRDLQQHIVSDNTDTEMESAEEEQSSVGESNVSVAGDHEFMIILLYKIF